MVEVSFQQINIDQQALEAKEAGEGEVARLLQAPEDLARLGALRTEWSGRLAGLSTGLGAAAGGQVEAARYGLALLDKSHRHIAKLRACIDRIDQLCGEAAALVEHHDKIRSLSLAASNVTCVLEELGDIIDLPQRAAALDQLLTSQPGALVTAFEG